MGNCIITQRGGTSGGNGGSMQVFGKPFLTTTPTGLNYPSAYADKLKYLNGVWILTQPASIASNSAVYLIASLDDMRTWTAPINLGNMHQTYEINYTNGYWTVVAAFGTLFYSSDARTWKNATGKTSFGTKLGIKHCFGNGDEYILYGDGWDAKYVTMATSMVDLSSSSSTDFILLIDGKDTQRGVATVFFDKVLYQFEDNLKIVYGLKYFSDSEMETRRSLIRSEDGGRTFTTVDTNISMDSFKSVASPQRGYAYGYGYSEDYSVMKIFRSPVESNLETWEELYAYNYVPDTGTTSFDIHGDVGVLCESEKNTSGVFANNYISYTTDGGKTFTEPVDVGGLEGKGTIVAGYNNFYVYGWFGYSPKPIVVIPISVGLKK